MEGAKLKKLIELFGVPDTLETGFVVGGPTRRRITDSKGKETGYSIGGRTGRQIISISTGEVIGSVSVGPVRRIYCDGKETNYQIGGRTGRKILYVKPAKVAS